MDEKHDNLSLNELLAFDLKLEPYENGRPPAKPKGAEAKRAAQNAPGAPDTATETTEVGTQIKVPYSEGAVPLEQVWKQVAPEAIRTDWRTAERFPAKLNVSLDGVVDIYDMFERVVRTVSGLSGAPATTDQLSAS